MKSCYFDIVREFLAYLRYFCEILQLNFYNSRCFFLFFLSVGIFYLFQTFSYFIGNI
jgi:hypothetical protein